MKPTLPLLFALLFGAMAALQAASSPDAPIVIASEAGAKLDSDVTKGGGSDDTALVQSILDRAPKTAALKLVLDGPALVSGLKVHSNTTIECLNRACGFYLADHSNHPLIVNATPQPEGRADHNLSFLGGTYNGNAEHQQHTTPKHGWTTAFALHGVEQVLFRDVSITNSRTFAVYLTNWRRVVFENIYINLDHIPKQSNQDGIHIQGPGEFLSIRNVQGRAWDDMIALNIDDLLGDWDSEGRFARDPASIRRFGSAAGIGPVSDVDIDGVQADDCAQVLRILSRASRLDRVAIRNCADCHAKIDPLGFALEAFDPIGGFRSAYPNGAPIDPSGEYRGVVLHGPADIRTYLSNHPASIAQPLVHKMLTYALGRPLGPGDQPALRRLQVHWEEKGYRLRELIHLVAGCELMKRP